MDATSELGWNRARRRLVTRDAAGTPAGDAALVSAARGGDRSAFGRLYDRYARMVHGLLLGRVGWAEADDLAQEVFLSAMTRLHTLREPEAFGAWLAAIARHRAADHRRRERRSAEGPAGGEADAAGSAPRREALEALETVRTLPAAYHETLILRLVEGMTGPEIARRTGMTPASVRVNLHRGMRMLRERLDARRGV